MTSLPKDPLDWLHFFRQQMTTIYRFLAEDEQRHRGGPEFSPSLDISETLDRFVVELDLPGARIEDLVVSVCCSLLHIRGAKLPDLPPRESNIFCLERRYGQFCRTVEIPPGFDLEQLQATLHRGVLTITVPRFPATRPVVREIAIGQGDT